MAGAAVPKDAQQARISDDEHVIVVIDSQTGEVRQCGDHSGYCVAMAPWKRADTLPMKLTAHAEDLERDAARAAAAPNDGKR